MLSINQAFTRIEAEKKHINNHLLDIHNALPANSDTQVLVDSFVMDDEHAFCKILKTKNALDELEL